MTEYRLPEGMTADALRDLADDPVANKVHAALHTWADAIDPPEPKSIVTDEMVEAYMRERFASCTQEGTLRASVGQHIPR